MAMNFMSAGSRFARSLLASVVALGFLSFSGPGRAADESGPRNKAIYNEAADADQDLARALAEASTQKKNVLVVFGANWCGDCLAFDGGARRAGLDQRFRVVKVDVGRFDKNEALAARLGVSLEKGIPTVAILDGNGQTVFTTQAGELANARAMGDKGIAAFFARKFE